MPRRAIFLFGFIVLNLLAYSVPAQNKYEREYRIKEKEVPEPALAFVRSVPDPGKVRWYSELSDEGKSLEAKLKYLNRRYSVEFDSLGKLQDIEVLTPWEEIAGEVRSRIRADLVATYEKHKIRKIQEQYRGTIVDLFTFVKAERPEEIYSLRYEIVIKGKKEKLWNLYEVTYDEAGNPLDHSMIILRNTDHIEY